MLLFSSVLLYSKVPRKLKFQCCSLVSKISELTSRIAIGDLVKVVSVLPKLRIFD